MTGGPQAGRLPLVHHEAYEVDIGPHVFPTRKYRLVLERLRSAPLWDALEPFRPEPATDEALRRVHTAEWIRKLEEGDLSFHERFTLEVPWSPALARAARVCCGGTTLAGRLALERGAAVHLGGGFHHAFPAHGEGFCPLNDVAVAVRDLRAAGLASRAMVIDLDVHHGNGTAAIFAEDPETFTLSMHQEANYPLVKPPGDLDLGLPDGLGDDAYLERLREHLPRAVLGHRPEVALYLAGADPYREDRLGGLALSLEGLGRRDAFVLATLREAGVPVAVCLAGGYAEDTADTVRIHLRTVEETVRAFARPVERA